MLQIAPQARVPPSSGPKTPLREDERLASGGARRHAADAALRDRAHREPAPRGEPADAHTPELGRRRVKIAIFPDLGPSVKGFCGNRTAKESRMVFIAERFGSLVLALTIVVLALVVVAFVLVAF